MIRFPRRLQDGRYGETDYDARTIRIWSGLGLAEQRWTMLHEAIHAILPDLSEEDVVRLEEGLRQVQAQVPDLWP
jgi:predicted mannosyl-3-phosphoglycerate phosphatase (HAD superfamily)